MPFFSGDPPIPGSLKGVYKMTYYPSGNISQRELFPGCRAKLVHTQNMTISQVNLDAGAVVPEHSHDHEQVSNVVEGKFEFTIDGVSHILGPGDVAVIPSKAPHVGKALTNCFILDVFYPVREDYK
jgi:quercetin dioxygenase-like cupin family protein